MQKPKRSGGFPKVFLGGLPSNVTETDLRSFFQRFGKVMEVVIMYDQEKKKSRGLFLFLYHDIIIPFNYTSNSMSKFDSFEYSLFLQEQETFLNLLLVQKSHRGFFAT